MRAELTTAPSAPAAPARGRDKEQALKEACEEFAALFWEQAVRAMRRTVPKAGLLDGGAGEEVFQGLLDGEYARQVARAEGSLAAVLFRQLKPLTKN
ncbi:MAG TPA: flagellar biosynthesis protein FlgJ [Firmicutes bacterium]|nr:flagellar biosynthesis protein FlgJ [Bacillota bacterium]